MKGIVLAGGAGTRLYPITHSVSKQMLPIYDKPMIYYPLSTLMLAGIRDILIISTPEDTPRFASMLGDGSAWGIQLSYKVQNAPNGLAEAFILGESFIGPDPVCLILGDNIFYGHDLTRLLKQCVKDVETGGGANIIGYYVKHPQRYGVVAFDENGKATSIEEKPEKPKSHYAVVGLYFYDNRVIEIAKNIKPSPRGELEITDVNNRYLKENKLRVQLMGRGFAWLDTGTHDSLLAAGNFVKTIEDRQGFKIACPEEIAFYNKWIGKEHLNKIANQMGKNQYRDYLLQLIDPDVPTEM